MAMKLNKKICISAKLGVIEHLLSKYLFYLRGNYYYLFFFNVSQIERDIEPASEAIIDFEC